MSSRQKGGWSLLAGVLWRQTVLGLTIFLQFASPNHSSAQTGEYQVKAAFLFNFAQFVTWPEGAFPSTNAPFVIGVLGRDPFGEILDEIVAGETWLGRKMEVLRCQSAEEASQVQILFISKTEESRLARTMRALRGKPVLTVSEIDDFARRGGMIRLYTAGDRVRFQINATEAKRCGLELSSKLLRLADMVGSNGSP